MKPKCWIMAVDTSKYELPIAVFETIYEAAAWYGKSVTRTYQAIWRDTHDRYSSGKARGWKFEKVEVE